MADRRAIAGRLVFCSRNFDVHLDKGAVVYKPVRFYKTNLEQIRSKIEKLGISENTVADAVKWARKQ